MGKNHLARGVLLAVVALGALAPSALANDCVAANNSGAWTDHTIWTGCGGGYPGPSDTAEIGASADVVLSGDTTVSALWLDDQGHLDLAGFRLTTGSATLGSAPATGSGNAVLNAWTGTGTLTATAQLQLTDVSIDAVDVQASGAQANLGDGHGVESSTWSGASFSDGATVTNLEGSYTLNGVSPQIGSNTVNVYGINSVQGTLTLANSPLLDFHPTAAGSATGPPMLSVSAIGGTPPALRTTLAGGYEPADGDRVNLLSAQSQLPQGVSFTGPAGATLQTDNGGARWYAAFDTPPSISIGTQAPSSPKAGTTVTVPFTTAHATSVTCTLDGAPIPCTADGATFTAPSEDSAKLVVTATNPSGSTTAGASVQIIWFPTLIDLSQDSSIVKSSWPAGAIECSRIAGAVPFIDSEYLAAVHAYSAVGGDLGSTQAGVDCVASSNSIYIVWNWAYPGPWVVTIPTVYGDYTVWLTNSHASSLSSSAANAQGGTTIGGAGSSGPLTCPSVAGAQGYVWIINGTYRPSRSAMLPASAVPADATIACAPIGVSGTLLPATLLVDQGTRIQATASTAAGKAARIARRRGGHVTLTLRASRADTVQVSAYTGRTTGSGRSARTRYGLAYRLTVTLRRGVTRLRFGSRLSPAAPFAFVVRGAHVHGHRTVYGRSLTIY